MDHPHDPPDGGLGIDLPRLLSRRSALVMLGGVGFAAALAACGSDGSSAASSSDGSASPTTTEPDSLPTTSAAVSDTTAAPAADPASCAIVPDETGGPFPGDGTNGPNVLADAGVVRRDITTSIGSASGTADGVPLTIRFKLVDTANGCAPVADAAVYAWHCTRDGGYSMYSRGFENENFLRGVQTSGADGVVEFDSIYPGCYPGRWPHIHFEVFPSLDAATSQAQPIKTSQIALPEEASEEAYASTGYEASVGNLKGLSLAGDNVFGDDGGVLQLGTISGDVANGLTVELLVGVDSTTGG